MIPYQKEQFETLALVRRHLATLSQTERNRLTGETADYLRFRDAVHTFLSKYFSEVCTQKCFQSRRSACCSKDGIITFFADWVNGASDKCGYENVAGDWNPDGAKAAERWWFKS